jgi:metal-sulfur cluster biosynthetic enzyme
MSLTEQQVFSKLKECYDPELPCNIVDLGLVYHVRLEPIPEASDTRIDVKMTLTSQSCPLSAQISAQIQQAPRIARVGEANVEVVSIRRGVSQRSRPTVKTSACLKRRLCPLLWVLGRYGD